MSLSPVENDDSNEEGQDDGCEDGRCRDPTAPVWHCVDCDSLYCSACWPLQGPHGPDKKGRDGISHEKLDVHLVRQLRTILTPQGNIEEIRSLHEKDQRNKWFGIARDLSGQPILEDYGRYATLMAEMGIASRQHPQLVSFIGVTNAGKSSLIKMLIHHNGGSTTPFPSPVVGSTAHGSVPTSGDVHLYGDPSTSRDRLPILYADCEGFEGGESTPLGSLSRKCSRSLAGVEGAWGEPVFRSRPIRWATTAESRQREHTVTALYPRLLYTFSDCIVFVLRNPKTFQSASLRKLLDWGASALEMSLNQPALPHCVVVLNSGEPGVPEREYDIAVATKTLLATVCDALDPVEGVPRFRELASHWRRLGRHISTVEDLINCYYRSFAVVRVPAQPQYKLMNDQIRKLHSTLQLNCVQSSLAKQLARMLIGADDSDTHLQHGFDHFTTYITIPFNFMLVSLQRSPIPSDFGEHILQLCTTLSAHFTSSDVSAANKMFTEVRIMLASCVLLDCARFRRGSPEQLFARYEGFFRYAITEYLQLHSPCTYISPDGSRSCVLVRARHLAKGHQDAQGIITTGEHVAALDWGFTERWIEHLRGAVKDVDRKFSDELNQAIDAERGVTIPDEQIALDVHLRNVRHFFQCVGSATRHFSHSTCFCCLMDTPQHPLPCKHVLCDKCVQGYGARRSRTVVLANCPLHPDDSWWPQPTAVQYKPVGAGVRVLSFDGGGIRGISQLEMLRAIEDVLGGHMPVQMLFDLMVGSGTGAVIATALQTKGQTLDQCADMFTAICAHAYAPRPMLAPRSYLPNVKALDLVRPLREAFRSRPQYKTELLHAALQNTFTSHADFFGMPERSRPNGRVAMTSARGVSGKMTVLANYRRPDAPGADYVFERAHDPRGEMKTWECLAATMASPRYFKPLNAHGTSYVDGGRRCTELADLAAKEASSLWRDVVEPDVSVSLGTCQNQAATRTEASRPANPIRKWRLGQHGDIFEAERSWQHTKAASMHRLHGKGLIRLNVDLGEDPPAQDRRDELQALQNRVRRCLEEPHYRRVVEHIAHRLVATEFYLELRSQFLGEHGVPVVKGSIACRRGDGTAELRALGRVLNHLTHDGFEPYFLIRPWPGGTSFHFRVTITTKKIARMVNDAVFEQPHIPLRLEDAQRNISINLFLSAQDGLEPNGLPISDFPRGIVRLPSDGTSPDAVSRGTTELPDANSQKCAVISEPWSAQHPAHSSQRSTSRDSNGTWSSLTYSAESPGQASNRSGRPGNGCMEQRPSVGSATPSEDAHPLGQRRSSYTWRMDRRKRLEDDLVLRSAATEPRCAKDRYPSPELHTDQLRWATSVENPDWDYIALPPPLRPRHDHCGTDAPPSGFVEPNPEEENDPLYLELVGNNTDMAPGVAQRGRTRSSDDHDCLNSFFGLST